MEPYIIRCSFWRKFENLEFEAHENRFLSISLAVVCARKNVCSFVYFLTSFKPNPSANNCENFNCSICTLSQCTVKQSIINVKLNFLFFRIVILMIAQLGGQAFEIQTDIHSKGRNPWIWQGHFFVTHRQTLRHYIIISSLSSLVNNFFKNLFHDDEAICDSALVEVL